MLNIKVRSKRRPSRVDAKASITLLISNNYSAIFPSVFSFIFWNMSIRAWNCLTRGTSEEGWLSLRMGCQKYSGFPPVIIKKDIRTEYYDHLDLAHTTSDYG